ncbi:MAG: orotidine-5'-phosphate decarboxylase [Alphaproteobacteria bacterium]|nr:orotidine-5'-phosphate decarboxylase [Alphaproteobacteria bacterium]
MIMTSPVFCAIDRPDLSGALLLARALNNQAVGGLKLGLEFVTANGPAGVRSVVDLGLPVFLDLKFHDIPNTVAGAVKVAADLGVTMLTLHLQGGPAMLWAAADAIKDLPRSQRPLLLGVSVLTSMDDKDLAAVGVEGSTEQQVLRLAMLARKTGLDGMVCSPREIKPLRQTFGDKMKLVVPGIRPTGCAAGDQKRTLTPGEAIKAGADYLVIGRPITAAGSPRAAALAIKDEIEAARLAA